MSPELCSLLAGHWDSNKAPQPLLSPKLVPDIVSLKRECYAYSYLELLKQRAWVKLLMPNAKPQKSRGADQWGSCNWAEGPGQHLGLPDGLCSQIFIGTQML